MRQQVIPLCTYSSEGVRIESREAGTETSLVRVALLEALGSRIDCTNRSGVRIILGLTV